MHIKYHCTNQNCSYPGVTQFEMTFKSETIADDHNVATLFCPFCKKEMTPSAPTDLLNPSKTISKSNNIK
ncbi:MAG: hypothetical protein GY729_16935 [Desulfobacteraceae bacterium]|nr:hypothetical protein [Desulfobacteraceae bacterium]